MRRRRPSEGVGEGDDLAEDEVETRENRSSLLLLLVSALEFLG